VNGVALFLNLDCRLSRRELDCSTLCSDAVSIAEFVVSRVTYQVSLHISVMSRFYLLYGNVSTSAWQLHECVRQMTLKVSGDVALVLSSE
jgi:hypothetical protein